MDDPEHEECALFLDEVVHDAVVADAEPVERVCPPSDRLHLLAANTVAAGRNDGELRERGLEALAQRAWQVSVAALSAR